MISTTTGEKPLSVMDEAYFNTLMNSTLMHDTLLLEIPENSKVYIMANGEKLYLHTDQTDDMQMQEVEGVVIKKGKADNIEVGETVIFHYLSLNNGRDGTGNNVFTFVYGQKLYHIIPYSQIYFTVKDGEYFSHNDNYLVEGIEVGTVLEVEGTKLSATLSSGGLYLVDVKKQGYEKHLCRIVSAPKDSEFKSGDVVVTNGVWDVPIKSDTMRKKEKKYYRCGSHNLMCLKEFVA